MARGCRRTRERLPEFLGGRLEGEGADRVSRHLESCPACSGEAEFLGRLRDLAGPLEARVEGSLPLLRERILAALGGRPPVRAWSPSLAYGALAAAAAGLLTFVLLFRPGGGTLPTPATGEDPLAFTVTLEEEGLVILWKENGEAVHRVYRSTSPSDFSNARVALVRGNRWVDREPQPRGTVYYYRVE